MTGEHVLQHYTQLRTRCRQYHITLNGSIACDVVSRSTAPWHTIPPSSWPVAPSIVTECPLVTLEQYHDGGRHGSGGAKHNHDHMYSDQEKTTTLTNANDPPTPPYARTRVVPSSLHHHVRTCETCKRYHCVTTSSLAARSCARCHAWTCDTCIRACKPCEQGLSASSRAADTHMSDVHIRLLCAAKSCDGPKATSCQSCRFAL